MPAPCWALQRSSNLEGAWPRTKEEACANRFGTLKEAMVACENTTACDGITIDGGVDCPIEGGAYASTWPGGAAMPFSFSARSLPTKRWAGMVSWVRTRDPGCARIAPPTEGVGEPPMCPVRTAGRAALSPPTNEQAFGSAAHSAALERRSAAEAEAVDASEVERGLCPSIGSSSSSADLPPLIAQLAALPTAGLSDEAACARRHRCALTHNEREFVDGWGAQHFRRATLFVAAAQLGCSYAHVPIATMNRNSQEHGVPPSLGERFFGLSHACWGERDKQAARAQRYRPPGGGVHASCKDPFGVANPVDLQPLRMTYALAALCNATHAQMLERWYGRVEGSGAGGSGGAGGAGGGNGGGGNTGGGVGRTVRCVHAPRVPPTSRCAWLRAVGRLRRRYYGAHGGVAPRLRWFTDDGARTPSLGPHVALHVRRGDLRYRDGARLISTAEWNRVLVDLTAALAEVQSRWPAAWAERAAAMEMNDSTTALPESAAAAAAAATATSTATTTAAPRLRPVVHIMSTRDYKEPSSGSRHALPLREWEALLASANATAALHLDDDPFVTMHHLIGADVLVKSQSGFSDVASLYSAGVKLYFVPSKDAPAEVAGLPQHAFALGGAADGAGGGGGGGGGLRSAPNRERFVRAVLSHLLWRAARGIAAPPPQARGISLREVRWTMPEGKGGGGGAKGGGGKGGGQADGEAGWRGGERRGGPSNTTWRAKHVTGGAAARPPSTGRVDPARLKAARSRLDQIRAEQNRRGGSSRSTDDGPSQSFSTFVSRLLG